MNKHYKIILVAFLIGITIFSAYQYIASLKERYDLVNSVRQLKSEAQVLSVEKQNLLQTLEKEKALQQELSQKNAQLKRVLHSGKAKIFNLNNNFARATTEIDRMNSQICALRAENTALREEKDKLTADFSQVSQETEDLKMRMSSLSELKKAMNELKRNKHRQPQAQAVVKERVISSKQVRIDDGNRGFVIKDGKPTYPAKVKIEVTPVSEQNND